MIIFMTNLVSYRTFRRPFHIPQTCFLVGTFFVVSYSKTALVISCLNHWEVVRQSKCAAYETESLFSLVYDKSGFKKLF